MSWNVLCFHTRMLFSVSLEGNASHVDVCKLKQSTATDKGILALFMPPLRHFNLEMLDISIWFFCADCRCNLLHHVPFFSTENSSASQRTKPEQEECCSFQGFVRHQQVLRSERKQLAGTCYAFTYCQLGIERSNTWIRKPDTKS